MNKKAQGLSMSTIIIAALALLVLVIIAALLLGIIDPFSRGTSCTGVGGTCEYDVCEVGYAKATYSGCEENQICCIPFGLGET